MGHLQAVLTANDLLQWAAADVYRWTTDARMHVVQPPRDFNWLGLAEGAGFNARDYAAQASRPIGAFSEEEQASLRAAICQEQANPAILEPELRRWLDATLPALNWSYVAIAAYDYLASISPARDRGGYQSSVMHLRAFLIARMGAISGNRALDMHDIVYWFFENLNVSFQTARDRALRWREEGLSRENARQVGDIRQLRRIKNRLGPVVVLIESGQLAPTPALQPWLALRAQLP